MTEEELEDIFNDIDDENKSKAKLLFEELSFIIETSKGLKEKIRETGTMETFQNGKQSFLRESPYLTSYNKLMKTFNILLNKLRELQHPKEKKQIFDDDFENDTLEDDFNIDEL